NAGDLSNNISICSLIKLDKSLVADTLKNLEYSGSIIIKIKKIKPVKKVFKYVIVQVFYHVLLIIANQFILNFHLQQNLFMCRSLVGLFYSVFSQSHILSVTFSINFEIKCIPRNCLHESSSDFLQLQIVISDYLGKYL